MVGRFSILCACFAACALIGCGDGAPDDAYTGPRGKISGTVTKGGKGVAEAVVNFSSKDGKFSLSATTDADGKYELTHGEEDAVPATDYTVTVSKSEVVSDEPLDPNKAGDEEVKSEVAAKYGDATTSGLTVTVKDGGDDTYDIKVD